MYIHSLENKKVVKTNLKSWTTEISCITVALALMIFTSTMDRKDEIRSFNQYCKDVSDQVYPDYKQMKSQCK